MLDSFHELLCVSVPVLALREQTDSDEMRVSLIPAAAGQRGVPLSHLAEVLDGLALVITAVPGGGARPPDGGLSV